MIKVGLVSLGCAKNLVDSEMMLAMFDKERFVLSNELEGNDLIIVNTCAFIQAAKEESIQAIFEAAKTGAKIVVVGCLAERYEKELKGSLPEADRIIPIHDYGELAQTLRDLTKEEKISPMDPLKRVISTPKYSAYLRISEGCDNFCAFCAIPYIRGRFVSRPYEEILEEAKILKERGVKEISIVSQDTASYGKDFPNHKPDFLDLLAELEKLGFYSIRLLYLYPDEISDSLIEMIAKSKSIKHYFDIPVQCASDHLLKRMNRHGTKKDMDILFQKIRKICPDAVLRTTLISGFPGENEEDQKETIEFLKEVRFDHLGVFCYSQEEGTAAAKYPDQIEESIKQSRRDEIMALQRKISYSNNKKRIGEIMEGIVIGKDVGENHYLLRSSWNAPDDIDGSLFFEASHPLEIGQIVKVKITGAFAYDLRGELVE